MANRLRQALALLGWTVVASGCGGSGYVDLNVRVMIPGEIRTIDAGELRLSLWSYDTKLADAPASLIDSDESPFSHRAGTRTERMLRVRGDVGGGSNRHYITVRGFEQMGVAGAYILWDGIRGTGTPKIVTMELVERVAQRPR